MDLLDEVQGLVDACKQAHLEYAIWGAVAVAYHGFVRATVELDLLVPDTRNALRIAGACGFNVASPRRNERIHRVAKIDAVGDHLTLGLLEVTPDLESAWATRIEVRPVVTPIAIVSREGLAITARAGTAQDRMDLHRLDHPEDEDAPDLDMSPGGLRRRHGALGQLFKLAMYLRDRRIVGPR